jgi:CubicO group peptidase (beta-lactamase class C family)
MKDGSNKKRDYWPTKEWKKSTPEKQGIDSRILYNLFERIIEKNAQFKNEDVQSILIVRNGYLVCEAYFHPYNRNYLHQVFSGIKGFMSTIVGIAIDDGYIKDVNQKVLDFFPADNFLNIDERKKKITVEDLLTLRSGIEWGKGEFDDVIFVMEMCRTDNWTKYCLDRPMSHEPGEYYDSISACPQILSSIINQQTGMNAYAYAKKKLFEPLGINDTAWWASSSGESGGGQGLYITPQDIAKLGYLYLNDGLWDGKQIVSKEWIEKATSFHCETEKKQKDAFLGGHGYLWYIDSDFPYYSFNTNGINGNFLYVIKELDLVVVTTAYLPRFAENPDDQHRNKIHIYMKDYILPACTSRLALPPNPSYTGKLDRLLNEIEQPIPSAYAELPDIAQKISGRCYRFDEKNSVLFFEDERLSYKLKSVSLCFNNNRICEATVNFIDSGRQKIVFPISLNNIFETIKVGTDIGDMPVSARGVWENNTTFTIYYNTWFGKSDVFTIVFDETDCTISCRSSTMLKQEINLNGNIIGYSEK